MTAAERQELRALVDRERRRVIALEIASLRIPVCIGCGTDHENRTAGCDGCTSRHRNRRRRRAAVA